MRNSCSFCRGILCYAGLALALGGLCGCSSTADRTGSTRDRDSSVAVSGEAATSDTVTSDDSESSEEKRSDRAEAVQSKAEAASEKKNVTNVERSSAADRGETAATTADAPRPVTAEASPAAKRVRRLEGGLRSLKTIPSLSSNPTSPPRQNF